MKLCSVHHYNTLSRSHTASPNISALPDLCFSCFTRLLQLKDLSKNIFTFIQMSNMTRCRRTGRPQGLGSSWGFKDGQFCVWECEADEEEEEEDEEEERLVSTPVLVIFILRRFASGALSTLLRKNPSRFPRLNAL